jgi:hypothetical protein
MADIDLGPLTPRAPDPLDNIVVVKESDPEEMGLLPVASFATAAQGALAASAVQPGDLASVAITAIGFAIDGGGEVVTTGLLGTGLAIPFSGTIESVTLLADQTGSIVIDIWKETFANYPPTVADSICASAKPTLSGAAKSEDTTLTGWTTSIAAGDVLRFNVDSASTLQNVTLILKVTKT